MSNTKKSNKFHVPKEDIDTTSSDKIHHIDPVPPREQVEEQDKYFNQMGDSENAKFSNQRKDDNEPLGSGDGEHGDEDTEAHPPKEEILQDDETA